VNETTELLAVRVAELYYEDSKSQDEIGGLLGITRWKVGRLLTQARDRGIVRIEISHPRARRLATERQLRERFGLNDAVVVPMPAALSELDARVTQAAADYLTAVRPIPRTLGVSWGRTIDQIAQRLQPGWSTGVTVVQINGGMSVNRRSGMAGDSASAIAQKAGGDCVLLPIPAILERIETKKAVESDRMVRSVLDLARTASMYLYSAGVVDASSILVDSGYLTPDDVIMLKGKGAVGDVVGRYIDADGAIVDTDLDDRTVGLGLDQLATACSAVFVVSGDAKHDVARAVVVNGLCTVLITDEATAVALLEDKS
jgi:deoxyribonucleoside regulator